MHYQFTPLSSCLPQFFFRRLLPVICSLLLVSGLGAQVNVDKLNQFIKAHARQLGLQANELNDFRVRSSYIDKLSGANIIHVQQTHSGIDVFNGLQTLAVKNDRLLSIMGSRVAMPVETAEKLTSSPRISPREAVQAALKHLNLNMPASLISNLVKDRPYEYDFGKMNISRVNIKSRLLWQAINKDEPFMLFWQVEIQPTNTADYWLVRVDAIKGIVTAKDNLTIYCNWGGNKHTAVDCKAYESHIEQANTTAVDNSAEVTSAEYRVIPYPVESPNHTGGTPTIVVNPWELSSSGEGATTLKWHNDGSINYESTRGNNVWAQEDVNGNNGSGKMAPSLTSGSNLNFDYLPDFNADPRNTGNQEFNITNLFYWNNLMHDIAYLYGFDEAAGNFQATNLDRPGFGDDFVFADAQDGSGINNANFGTPEDGISPRMQMFLWDGQSPLLDGDVDNGIIAHEYGHGISNRLTGGPLATTCLANQEQMGEGWSDYFSLMMTTNWSKAKSSDGAIGRGIGTYATGEPTTGLGIRDKQYSTNFAVNNHTYKSVRNAGFGSFYSVHFIGEIWCTVLWDMTWALIQQDGINTDLFNPDGKGGNSIALQLVMTGMKLQSCSPGFIDGRDAILKADTLLYNGKYSCTIWNAFARRGLGVNASQGSSFKYRDQVEDFTLPAFTSLANNADKSEVAEGGNLKYKFTVNCSCEDINNHTIENKIPENLEYVSGGSYDAGNRTVSFSGINLTQGTTAEFTIETKVKDATYSSSVVHINDEIDQSSLETNWLLSSTGGSFWSTVPVPLNSGSNSYFVNEVDVTALASLSSTQAYKVTGLTYLSFWHLWYTEPSYDGGWIQISTNNGASWTDIPASLFIKNGYNNNLFKDNSESRKAFSGFSTDIVQSIVDLSSFAGQDIYIRFQFSCDEGTSYIGWYLDDISLISSSGVYNVALLKNQLDNTVNTSVTTTNIIDGALPVSFGSFIATKLNNREALLQWTTLSELNAANFIIERSVNGAAFLEIGKVTAVGNSNSLQSYSFTDVQPQKGDNQYRLRQVDRDGKSMLSVIRMLNFEQIAALIKIMPNPASRFLSISLPAVTKPITVKLINASGTVVFMTSISGQINNLQLPQLAAGQYRIHLESSEINHQQALLIK